MSHLRIALFAALIAVGLAWIFWEPLFRGGGFVGGDIYSYYFPQKSLYAEALKAGDVPYWNPRTGLGYPFVAESQTGVFYPFHLLAYRLAGLNTAYSAIHLLHYVLAFVFTVLYARSFGLSRTSAALASLVFTFGWFPARSCVEWAIVGGAWLPAALWCVERFLQTRWWRYAIGLSVVLGAQMLAGHFEIAFITQLTLATYIPLRLWWAGDAEWTFSKTEKGASATLLTCAVALGFALAAVQLLPTAELKRLSQRATADEHEIEFGSIPLRYLSQAVLPWIWYSPFTNRDALLQRDPPALGGRTNQVEAHLYFGLLPLALALWGAAFAVRTRDRKQLVWVALGVAAMVYTTGVLLPMTRHLPGFSFFQGPGRYGIVTTLAVGVLAGSTLDRLRAEFTLTRFKAALLLVLLLATLGSCWSLATDSDLVAAQIRQPSVLHFGRWQLTERAVMLCGSLGAVVAAWALAVWSGFMGRTIRMRFAGIGCAVALVFAATLCDLWIVSRLVTYTTIVDDPPIRHLAESELRQVLANEPGPVRLFAPGANLPNVLGVSSTPAYFTFAPAEYSDPTLMMPQVSEKSGDPSQQTSPEQLDWLRRAGVTHVLSFQPLDSSWPAELVWQGHDAVLNGAWSRPEALHLSRLHFDPGVGFGRVRFAEPSPVQIARVTEYSPDRVVIETNASKPGRLILTDLMYPGWEVAVDGKLDDALTVGKMYRAVDLPQGSHTIVWSYQPNNRFRAAAISVGALVFLAAVAHVRFWHGGWRKPPQ